MAGPPDPNVHGSECIGLGWALLVVSSGVIILRFYTRINRIGRVAIDDYLMFCAWVSLAIGHLKV